MSCLHAPTSQVVCSSLDCTSCYSLRPHGVGDLLCDSGLSLLLTICWAAVSGACPVPHFPFSPLLYTIYNIPNSITNKKKFLASPASRGSPPLPPSVYTPVGVTYGNLIIVSPCKIASSDRGEPPGVLLEEHASTALLRGETAVPWCVSRNYPR